MNRCNATWSNHFAFFYSAYTLCHRAYVCVVTLSNWHSHVPGQFDIESKDGPLWVLLLSILVKMVMPGPFGRDPRGKLENHKTMKCILFLLVPKGGPSLSYNLARFAVTLWYHWVRIHISNPFEKPNPQMRVSLYVMHKKECAEDATQIIIRNKVP